MRRSIAAAAVLALTAALTVAASAPAQADTLPILPDSPVHYMVGALDSLEWVPGEGVIATGWLFDSRNPTAAIVPDEYQILNPDGKASWWGSMGGQLGLPRPDVAAAHPEAGPNHGYRYSLGFPEQFGTYQFCAEAWFEIMGCGYVTVPREVASGAIEVVAPQRGTDSIGFHVRGWTADSWARYPGNSVTTTVSYLDPASSQWTIVDQPWVTSDIDRPDVRAARPDLSAVKGFDVAVNANRPGTYMVCMQVQPQVSRYASTVDLGCKTTTFEAATVTVPAAISGAAELGSTLTFTPATWSPVPRSEHVWWSNSVNSGPLHDGEFQYPLTVADVGHSIAAFDVVDGDGVLGGSTYASVGPVTIPGVTTSRLSGDDRYAGAIANSKAQFPDASTGAPVVYIASGANFPDALSAGPAAAKEGGALLLTAPDRLIDGVRAEIQRLHPASIVLVGGSTSVSDAVLHQLEKLAPTQRIGGADRYAVSRAVAEHAFADGAPSAYLVTGANYPDALAAGPAAGSTGAPVILTYGLASKADAATRDELASLGTKEVTIVGGTASVTAGVEKSLGTGIRVTRLAGPDRFTAAIALNRATFSTADTVYLATGLNFPDGLAVGARAGASGSPLYLVDGTCVPRDVVTDIAALHARHVVVVGGGTVMSSNMDRLYACD